MAKPKAFPFLFSMKLQVYQIFVYTLEGKYTLQVAIARAMHPRVLQLAPLSYQSLSSGLTLKPSAVDLRYRNTASHIEHDVEVCEETLHDVSASVFALVGHAPDEQSSDHDCVCTERDGFGHIGAPTEAAVDEDGHLVADGRGNLRKHFYGRYRAVELPPSPRST